MQSICPAKPYLCAKKEKKLYHKSFHSWLDLMVDLVCILNLLKTLTVDHESTSTFPVAITLYVKIRYHWHHHHVMHVNQRSYSYKEKLC